MYRIEIANAVKSDIRKLDKRLQGLIGEEHFANIEKDPFKAEARRELNHAPKIPLGKGHRSQ